MSQKLTRSNVTLEEKERSTLSDGFPSEKKKGMGEIPCLLLYKSIFFVSFVTCLWLPSMQHPVGKKAYLKSKNWDQGASDFFQEQ